MNRIVIAKRDMFTVTIMQNLCVAFTSTILKCQHTHCEKLEWNVSEQLFVAKDLYGCGYISFLTPFR